MVENLLYSCIDKYKDIIKNKNISVAVSGGIDSMALMLILDLWCKNNNTNLTAITVDHKLREESTNEAIYVNSLCKEKNIKHVILTWEGEKPDHNIELIARENRYKLISNYCKNNKIDYVFIAHHLQDQAETFLIRLFRGSGIDGLSSMKKIAENYNLKIIRPFLNIEKEDLKQYLLENKIEWVEDESNNEEKYLRNKIRLFLNSFENRDDIIKRIDFAVNQINDCKVFIDSYIKKIERKIVSFNSFGTCILNKHFLLQEDENIILKILAQISMAVSGNKYKPRLEKLRRLLDTIQNEDKIKYTFYGCVFESYNNDIMVYREYNSIKEDVDLIYNQEVIWDNRFKIILTKNISGLKVGCIKMGDFNKILFSVRDSNYKKYKEMKNITGIEKNIFYTLPTVKDENNNYIFDFEDLKIEFIK